MEIAELLDKEEHYQYILTQLISLKNTYVFNYSNLKEMAGLSDFTLNKYLDELNYSWQEFFEQELIQVDNREISYVETINSRRLNEFKRKLITNSLGFKMLEALFQDKFSLQAFSKEYYISQSKIYDIRRKIASLLKPYHIKIKKDRLVGNEQIIRNLMLEIYNAALNGSEIESTKELTSHVNAILNVVITNYKLHLSPSQNRKLQSFITVNEMRNLKENALNFSLKVNYSQLDETLFSLLRHRILLDDEHRQQEINYLLCFLYANGFIEELELQLAVKKQLIDCLTQDFIASIFPDLRVKEKEFSTFPEALNKINQVHTRLVLFKVASSTFISNEQFKFFEEIYHAHHQTVLNYIEKNKELAELLPSESEKTKLYYDYMFILITYFPIEKLEEPIYICVDFSHGTSYTNYIMEEIRRFKDINLQIEKRISNKTEIYVSDYEYPKFPREQVIWKNPPDSTDWQYFGDLIVQLRRGKYEDTSV